jgi:hypothetical protein
MKYNKYLNEIEKELDMEFELKPTIKIINDKKGEPKNYTRESSHKITKAVIEIPQFILNYNEKIFIVILKHEIRENLLFQNYYISEDAHDYALSKEKEDINNLKLDEDEYKKFIEEYQNI